LSSKKKTNTTSTTGYSYLAPPPNPYEGQLQAELAQGEQADPRIQYSAADAKNRLRNRLNNPFGADYSPETSEAIKYAEEGNIDTQAGQARAEDRYRQNQTRWGKIMNLAALRQGQFAQTSGTQNTVQSTPFNWGGLLLGGASAFGV
jgi:hypothetical protein